MDDGAARDEEVVVRLEGRGWRVATSATQKSQILEFFVKSWGKCSHGRQTVGSRLGLASRPRSGERGYRQPVTALEITKFWRS